MFDTLLSASLRLTVHALIAGLTVGALILTFWGLIRCLNGGVTTGAIMTAAGVLPGVLAYRVASARDDVIGAV